MPKQKVILICDPGIDGAFAVALALFDPSLEVLALAATAGNVSAEQATKNIHILIDQLDPPRWPRLGAAPAVSYDLDGRQLHGPNGLGATSFECNTLHHLVQSDKLVADCVKQHPEEVTVVCMGPCTVLARAMDIYPEFSNHVKRIICVGGAWKEPGNAGPVAEFHFACDPMAARQVVRSGAPILLIPLDVSRQLSFSPSDLLGLPADASLACSFLRAIVPHGIAATSSMYGIEGFHLKDVAAIIALTQPDAVTTRPMTVDVETRGELTRGMSVFDQRNWTKLVSNVDLAVHVDGAVVHKAIHQTLVEPLP